MGTDLVGNKTRYLNSSKSFYHCPIPTLNLSTTRFDKSHSVLAARHDFLSMPYSSPIYWIRRMVSTSYFFMSNGVVFYWGRPQEILITGISALNSYHMKTPVATFQYLAPFIILKIKTGFVVFKKPRRLANHKIRNSPVTEAYLGQYFSQYCRGR